MTAPALSPLRTPSPLRVLRLLVVALVVVLVVAAARPAPASAGLCGAVGAFSGWAGKACTAVSHPDRLIKAGKNLVTGHPGRAVKSFLSSGGGKAAIGLAALVTWVVVGARSALNATAGVIERTTTPQLRSTWFSGLYWRMTAIGALLTLPFLFAAAAQSIVRSDLAMLSRAALGYLPLSLLAVSVAAPVAMLLLTATDQMSAVVSAAAGQAGSRFLTITGQHVATLDPIGESGFLKFFIALLASAAAVVLWLEMLMRDAAVYIVVLMLPLAFAAMVWPARRVWAIRIAEMLVALIIAKFVIVAILALGGAALGPAGGTTGLMVGLVLVTLAAVSPWAMLRLLPLAELASGAAGQLRTEFPAGAQRLQTLASETGGRPLGWAGDTVAGMRRSSEESADGAPPVIRDALPAGPPTEPTAAEGGVETAGAAGPGAAVPRTSAGASGPDTPGDRDSAVSRSGSSTTDDGPDPGSTTTVTGAAATGATAEPIATLPDVMKADDLTAAPVVLGLEGLPPGPLHRRQAAVRSGAGDAGDAPGPAIPPGDDINPLPPVQESDPPSPADDTDPLPPAQTSDEGMV